MNTEFIRSYLQTRPFVAFDIHMTNGDIHPVTHPESALLAGTRLFVYYPETDRVAIVSLLHIASLSQTTAA